MPSSRNILALTCCLGLVLPLAGCRSSTTEPEVRRPSVQEDACAARLHDLSGQLLLYYSLHGRLPESLDALPPLDAADPTPAVCPVSGEPYVYDPKGKQLAEQQGLLVLYDPAPTHTGMRWGVFVERVAGHPRLTARVILVPERCFTPEE